MKNLKRKLGLAATAALASIALALGGAIPAEAFVYSTVIDCAWSQKANYQITNIPSGTTVRLEARSSTGWILGTRTGTGNQYWATPWQHVTIFATTNASLPRIYKSCRI